MNKKQKIAFILNILVFAFTLFATICIIIGFKFMEDVTVLSEKNLKSFRYFTVQSNIFAAIVSLIYIIYNLRSKVKKTEKLPTYLYVLKLAAVTSVTLTMMVTVFYLAPRSKTTYFSYFMNSNLFMHFITPVLCILSFIFFESSEKLPLKISFTGVIPMVLYASYYTPNVLLHLNNGKVNPDYDWYGFLAFGVNTVWFVIPFLIAFTWIFSFSLWALNKKLASN